MVGGQTPLICAKPHGPANRAQQVENHTCYATIMVQNQLVPAYTLDHLMLAPYHL
jgi:hypothetical protein